MDEAAIELERTISGQVEELACLVRVFRRRVDVEARYAQQLQELAQSITHEMTRHPSLEKLLRSLSILHAEKSKQSVQLCASIQEQITASLEQNLDSTRALLKQLISKDQTLSAEVNIRNRQAKDTRRVLAQTKQDCKDAYLSSEFSRKSLALTSQQKRQADFLAQQAFRKVSEAKFKASDSLSEYIQFYVERYRPEYGAVVDRVHANAIKTTDHYRRSAMQLLIFETNLHRNLEYDTQRHAKHLEEMALCPVQNQILLAKCAHVQQFQPAFQLDDNLIDFPLQKGTASLPQQKIKYIRNFVTKLTMPEEGEAAENEILKKLVPLWEKLEVEEESGEVEKESEEVESLQRVLSGMEGRTAFVTVLDMFQQCGRFHLPSPTRLHILANHTLTLLHACHTSQDHRTVISLFPLLHSFFHEHSQGRVTLGSLTKESVLWGDDEFWVSLVLQVVMDGLGGCVDAVVEGRVVRERVQKMMGQVGQFCLNPKSVIQRIAHILQIPAPPLYTAAGLPQPSIFSRFLR